MSFVAPQILTSLYANVTSIATDILQASKPIEGLYANVDMSTLNVLEKAWVAWYEYFDSPVVATGVMSFLMHEVRAISS